MRTLKVVEVRFPTEEGQTISSELAKPPVKGCERVVLALAGLSRTAQVESVLVNNPRPVPEDAYYMAEEGAAWNPRFTAEVAREALRRRLGVLMIHSHPFSGVPHLSGRDKRSFELVLPALKTVVPWAPHGSLVLGLDGAVGGTIWFPGGGLKEVGRARWMGSPLRIWPNRPHGGPSGRLYESQADLIGDEGQHLLSDATMGVIGLGGGGSHIVQQASRAGFGKLVLVDHDQVEEKNRSRTVGTRVGDVGKSKIIPMRRVVREVSNSIKLDYCTERFPSQTSIDKLKACDVVISCVDTLSARAEIIKFAWRHVIPLVDIGIGTHTTEKSGVRQIDQLAGHVHLYLPGGPCMWCSGLLSSEKLRAETGDHPEYLQGRGGPGQVISFNGVVASLAVTQAFHLVTGALQGGQRRQFIQYDGMTPALMYSDPVRNASCVMCNAELGAGDPV